MRNHRKAMKSRAIKSDFTGTIVAELFTTTSVWQRKKGWKHVLSGESFQYLNVSKPNQFKGFENMQIIETVN